MTEKKETNRFITFAIIKTSTVQFAIIEGTEINEDKIGIVTNLRFGADDKEKVIAVFFKFSFESDSKPFIIIEASCHFKIINKDWGLMLNSKSNSLLIPKGFLSHLAVITVGTTRGILHAKTEDTFYNKYVLPTINVTSLIKEDGIINFNSEQK